jgi:hypothetical protein
MADPGKTGEPLRTEELYETEQATIVMLPNKGPVGLIPYDASGFVTTDYKVEFKDGTPVAWTASRPSELASVFRIPVDIAKAIVSIPAELIKLRVDVATNSAAETKAKLDLLCAQLALDAAEKLRSDQTTAIAPTLPLCDSGAAGGS